MGTYEGLGVSKYGAFTRENEAQTTVWTVLDNGSMIMSIGSSAATGVYGLEIDLDTTVINATSQYNIILKKSSTKVGTIDAFMQLELGSTLAVATSCFHVGNATVDTRPSYFLSVAATAVSANAAGFVDERKAVANTTASPMGMLACLVGTTSYYIPMFHATNTSSCAAQ